MNKMNKKAEGLGMFIMLFIGIIVAIALFSGTFESVGNMRNIYTITNETVTIAAINASTTLTGRSNTTVITVVNASDGTDWSANYSVTTTNTGGALAILLTTSQNAGDIGQAAASANVTYSYKPQGYNDSSGARGIIIVILIMSSLAIAVFVIPGFREIAGN